jgi:hypothetical protein
LEFCGEIGITLAAEKTVLPTQIIDFVGITIDVKLKETHLPNEKVDKCKQLLSQFSVPSKNGNH